VIGTKGFWKTEARFEMCLMILSHTPYAFKETRKKEVQDILDSLGEDVIDMSFLCPGRSCGFKVRRSETELINQWTWASQES
jgi:hypothetical protein